MRGLLSIFVMLVAILGVVYAQFPPLQKPNPHNPGFPNFPGHGPFNPRARPPPVFRHVRILNKYPYNKHNGIIIFYMLLLKIKCNSCKYFY